MIIFKLRLAVGTAYTWEIRVRITMYASEAVREKVLHIGKTNADISFSAECTIQTNRRG